MTPMHQNNFQSTTPEPEIDGPAPYCCQETYGENNTRAS